MHSERIIADVIARFMYARMVAGKSFDKLPVHVRDSYRADGVNLVRLLRETYSIEMRTAVELTEQETRALVKRVQEHAELADDTELPLTPRELRALIRHGGRSI